MVLLNYIQHVFNRIQTNRIQVPSEWNILPTHKYVPEIAPGFKTRMNIKSVKFMQVLKQIIFLNCIQQVFNRIQINCIQHVFNRIQINRIHVPSEWNISELINMYPKLLPVLYGSETTTLFWSLEINCIAKLYQTCIQSHSNKLY